ncbi:hypothetical protein [Legionella fallonii]|uniref:Integral membrane protein (PIN domain superfamily) n=1 Tax=Legionella fallonii LLAP-10 TaxID=1212491 RepID=A0A098G8A5_9GAMM|nr:hypothetical protein [Legionella fallonii]CEG58214.1 conserved membrane protein of unknown function [Legionella fallonii LLAP-10]
MVHPSFHTFVLSQAFGIYLVIMAIIFACRAKYYKQMIQSINPNGPGILISGSLGLLIGLFLITIHNSWGLVVVDILSLFFWFIVISSLLLLSFPERVVACAKKVCGGRGYFILIVACALLGIILMTGGYYLYM